MPYKWCVVPKCTNTSVKTPEKMFVTIPKNTEMRKKWLLLAGRNPKDIAASTHAFMCEDHFNIEKDMANYTQYKMGFSQSILMVKGAIPSKFYCQEEGRKRLSDTTLSQTASTKRVKIVKETEAVAKMPGTSTLEDENNMPETAVYITCVKIEKESQSAADMLGTDPLQDEDVMPETALYMTRVKIEKETQAEKEDMAGTGTLEDENNMPETAVTRVKIERETQAAADMPGSDPLEDENVLPETAVYMTHVKIEKETQAEKEDMPGTGTLEDENVLQTAVEITDNMSAIVMEDHTKLPVVSTVHVDVPSLVKKFNSMKAELEEMRDRLEASESTIRDLRNELLQLKCNNSLRRSPKHPTVSTRRGGAGDKTWRNSGI